MDENNRIKKLIEDNGYDFIPDENNAEIFYTGRQDGTGAGVVIYFEDLVGLVCRDILKHIEAHITL